MAHNYSVGTHYQGLILLVMLHEIIEGESITNAKVVRLGMGGIVALGAAAYYLGPF